jgi:hypothetical protein
MISTRYGLRTYRCNTCREEWADYRRADAVRCPDGHYFVSMTSRAAKAEPATFWMAVFLIADAEGDLRMSDLAIRRLRRKLLTEHCPSVP